MILNTIIITIFTVVCLCDILDIFGEHVSFFSELLFLGPLFLTCIVFNIALCKIKNSIKAIKIAKLNVNFITIHFFNIITYTVLVTAGRIFLVLRERYDIHGDAEEVLKYY